MHLRVFTMDLTGIHVWRQTQTQTNIQNFYEEDLSITDPRINYRGETDGILRMEFPVMQWLIALLYKVFGDHIAITRIFTFILGLFSVWGMYRLAHSIFHNRKTAVIAAWCFNFSPVFYYYTVNPLPDNFALCCSLWGLAFFFEWINTERWSAVIFAAFFLSLSTLAKLPFVLFAIVPGAYLLRGIFISKKRKGSLAASVIYIALFVPAAAWYVWVVPGWTGNGVVKGILDADSSQVKLLLDILIGNIVSTLPELLINYAACVFFVWGIYIIIKRKIYKHKLFYLFALLAIAVIAYFLFELNMISTVHDYYMFPFLPGLFLVVSLGAYYLLSAGSRPVRIFSTVLLLALPLTAFLRIDTRWDEASPGFNADLLKYKKELRAAVPDTALCVAGNDVSQNIFFYYIHKKGWTFHHDSLPAERLKEMIGKGAVFLYSDSRKLEESFQSEQLLDTLVMKAGSIHVYRLSR